MTASEAIFVPSSVDSFSTIAVFDICLQKRIGLLIVPVPIRFLSFHFFPIFEFDYAHTYVRLSLTHLPSINTDANESGTAARHTNDNFTE